jgi:hypothetical protein
MSGWEHIDFSSTKGSSQGRVWQPPVPGGRLYKVTEHDFEGHLAIQICFVPYPKEEAPREEREARKDSMAEGIT